jgi:hypothetical protein
MWPSVDRPSKLSEATLASSADFQCLGANIFKGPLHMRLLHVLHSVTNAQLARFNLTVCRRDSVPSIERFFSYLRGSKLAPKTIIDVGVANGTEWLYEAFPKAKFHLIDPTRESMPHMQAWSQKLNAEVHNVALGAEDGVAELQNQII